MHLRAWVGLAVAFLFSEIAQYYEFGEPFIRSYINDILCLPITLYVALVVQRRLCNNGELTLPWTHAAAGVIFFGVIFEMIVPRFDSRYTQDPLDVLAYALGAVIFMAGINKRGGKSDNDRGLRFGRRTDLQHAEYQ